MLVQFLLAVKNINAWMIFTGVVCRLQICRCLKAQWFDSTFRAIIIIITFVFLFFFLFYFFDALCSQIRALSYFICSILFNLFSFRMWREAAKMIINKMKKKFSKMDISNSAIIEMTNPLLEKTFKSGVFCRIILLIQSLTLNLFSLSMTYCE